MEVRPKILAIVGRPYYGKVETPEFDPAAATYWCWSCGRRGTLEGLGGLNWASPPPTLLLAGERAVELREKIPLA
ncbi:MAG: hypothetical protein NUW23_15010 [Firmicutes bacterium]|jgi:hypothetical protein|nr:hypothetical protein [Bacillota bacterium]